MNLLVTAMVKGIPLEPLGLDEQNQHKHCLQHP